MTIGERIKQLRTKKNISQVDFADKINVSKQTLYKYENGIVTNIPSDRIEAIAKLCNISPAYLMGWETEDTIVAKGTDETTPSIPKIIEHYNKGKKEATKRVQELTYFPLYIQSDDSTSELSVDDIPDTFEEMEKKGFIQILDKTQI